MGILRAKCDECGVEVGADDILGMYDGRYFCKKCDLAEDIKDLERDIKSHEGTIENANKKITELRQKIKELQSQKNHASSEKDAPLPEGDSGEEANIGTLKCNHCGDEIEYKENYQGVACPKCWNGTMEAI